MASRATYGVFCDGGVLAIVGIDSNLFCIAYRVLAYFARRSSVNRKTIVVWGCDIVVGNGTFGFPSIDSIFPSIFDFVSRDGDIVADFGINCIVERVCDRVVLDVNLFSVEDNDTAADWCSLGGASDLIVGDAGDGVGLVFNPETIAEVVDDLVIFERDIRAVFCSNCAVSWIFHIAASDGQLFDGVGSNGIVASVCKFCARNSCACQVGKANEVSVSFGGKFVFVGIIRIFWSGQVAIFDDAALILDADGIFWSIANGHFFNCRIAVLDRNATLLWTCDGTVGNR